MSKLVKSIEEAVRLSGLKDGMTISFHHHLRSGDYVLNIVMDVIASMGIRDLNINATSIHPGHAPLVKHLQSGVVTGIDTPYIAEQIGGAISRGVMKNEVVFRSHGHRAGAIMSGETPIDVAFIAAPSSDPMGNCTGKYGKSACGCIGYMTPDAMKAKKVIVITDNLVPYPLVSPTISEVFVDYVVNVDCIGDPAGIIASTTKMTRDAVALRIAELAAKSIQASGLLKDGFSFQTGAGGASLAAAGYLKEIMLREKIQGSYIMGGITGYLVDLLEAGCFRNILDVQCFDLRAVESLRSDPRHVEVTGDQYASPTAKSCEADSLDAVILGATEIDLDFNVNVHTDSAGIIMGGSGGHTDTAACSKLSVIVAPLIRARLPIVTKKVLCVSTPGSTVDVLVTQRGIAVNPERKDLLERFRDARLPVVEIEELYRKARSITGDYEPIIPSGRPVAKVLNRDGAVLDYIRQVD